MPTEKQIAAQLKREQAEINRGIIDQVTSAALHILHESYLPETTLWPKKGFKAGYRSKSAENNAIIYSARRTYELNYPVWQAIYFQCMNKSERRCINQQKHIYQIMDSAIYDGIHFDLYEYNPGMHYAVICPFSGLYYSDAVFKFTIND